MKTKKLMPMIAMVIFFLLTVAFAFTPKAKERKLEKSIIAGNTYDLYLGQCGMFFMDAPVDGKITIEREGRQNYPLRFIKDVCTVEYAAQNGDLVKSFSGMLNYYIVLNRSTLEMWEDGDLAFYIEGARGWAACSPVLIPDSGYGRLSCWTDSFGSFGLVNISEKADDDDEKAAKGQDPTGEFVLAGQALDLYEGICGVYMASVPADGYVDIDRDAKGDHQPRFIKDVCDFSYKDAKDKELGAPGLTMAYVNLTRAQATDYVAGDLAFFVNSGSGWSQCANPLLLQEGGNPRLCCTVEGSSMFGIGDISVKEKDDNGD